jgi:hypothetical protein
MADLGILRERKKRGGLTINCDSQVFAKKKKNQPFGVLNLGIYSHYYVN